MNKPDNVVLVGYVVLDEEGHATSSRLSTSQRDAWMEAFDERGYQFCTAGERVPFTVAECRKRMKRAGWRCAKFTAREDTTGAARVAAGRKA